MNGRDFYTGTKIYWRKNRGKWQGILYYKDDNGKQRQKGIMLTPKKRESQEMFEKIKAELNEQMRINPEVSKAIPMSSKTVGDKVKEYLKRQEGEVAAGHMEQSTLSNKTRTAELYIYPEDISKIPFTKLSKDDINAWTTALSNRGISTTTMRTPFSLIRQVYTYELERGTIHISPFQYLKTPSRAYHPINYATEEAMHKLLNKLDSDWKDRRGDTNLTSYYLALYLGLRGEEVSGLMWKDVTFSFESSTGFGYVQINQVIARNQGQPYVKKAKTQSSQRDIPLFGAIELVLMQRHQVVCAEENVEKPNPSWFVTGRRDKFKSPELPTYNFTKYCKRNGIIGSEGKPLSMHCLRDTFATLTLQKRTMDIKTLSGILGHSSVTTTLNLYAGYGDDMTKLSGMDAIGKAMKEMKNNEPKKMERYKIVGARKAEAG